MSNPKGKLPYLSAICVRVRTVLESYRLMYDIGVPRWRPSAGPLLPDV